LSIFLLAFTGADGDAALDSRESVLVGLLDGHFARLGAD